MAFMMFPISSFDWLTRAERFARLNAGNSNAANIPMMLITTNNSISVNPRR
jgi:hypothetical protein